MTDVSAVKAHADYQPTSVVYGAPPPFTDRSPALDGTIEEEESSTIKCICGFQEDDGNTVLCEKCDTWQHIVCYYDTLRQVPDVHECADCSPRPLDAKGAAEKQRQRRELQNIGERRGKPKTGPKAGKKRTKDPLGLVQPNGWAVHSNSDLHFASERKSGSPHNQPPPTKRPKTNHRASTSVSLPGQPPNLPPASRKRAASTLHNGHSPAKSPTNLGPNGGVVEEYSPEFLQLYRQPDPPSADSNSHTDIRVANDISLWLTDREALFQATEGKEPGQVFERVDQTIEELGSLAPPITKQSQIAHDVTIHGLHPQWKYLTVESFVPTGSYLGELKGTIGRRSDYILDPSNRWDLLQHPAPFVFFTPHLPLYIDMRQEGSILRYARRSCRPNMIMKIFTHSDEGGYHFCFVAIEDVHPDEELTVGWDIPPEMRQLLGNADIRKEGFKKLEPWISCVLSNFGGCACRKSKENQCFLDLARRASNSHAEPAQPPKATKARKSKKTQVSPLSTGHATNSRAGSETVREGAEDDRESRSTSASHSKPASRDITPMTHFSVDDGVKLSDREKRKIQQQERLFEQLEYDEQHGSKRRKRNSAGSALNTPSLSSSKQIGLSEPSPSSSSKPRDRSNGTVRKVSGGSSKANGCPKAPKPRPVYVDCATQTDLEPSAGAPTTPLPKKGVTKPPLSFKRRLIKEAAAERRRRESTGPVKLEASSPALDQLASAKASPISPVAPALQASAAVPEAVSVPSISTAESHADPQDSPPQEDVEMKDPEEASATKPEVSTPKLEEMPDAPSPAPSSVASHPPIQPDPPPWPTPAHLSEPAPAPPPAALSTAPPSVQKPIQLRIPLPPPPETLSHPLTANSALTPGSTMTPGSAMTPGSTMAQSPLSALPLNSPFSPSVSNVVNPTPARKKISFSEFTSRRHKMAQTQASSGTPLPAPALLSTGSSPPSLTNNALLPPTGAPAKSPEVGDVTISVPMSTGTLAEEGKAIAAPASTSPATSSVT